MRLSILNGLLTGKEHVREWKSAGFISGMPIETRRKKRGQNSRSEKTREKNNNDYAYTWTTDTVERWQRKVSVRGLCRVAGLHAEKITYLNDQIIQSPLM